MTIIAWDGKLLAADRADTNVGYMRTTNKIYRVPDGLVGFAGDGSRAMELLHWFMGGRDPAKYPAFQATEETVVDSIFINNQGVQYGYQYTPYPQIHYGSFDAIGSGRDYALAAMHLGFGALQAVQVACDLDNCCGKGIDTLTLDSPISTIPE